MDVDNLLAGDGYQKLKDSYVIFLCLGDSISNGLPVYTFRYRADEDHSVLMNDGTVNIFFNAKKYDKMKSPKLRSFFEYLCKEKPDSPFTDRLARLVERIKTSPQERKAYMMFSEIVQKEAQEMREECRAEGMEEKALETAKNLLNMNLTSEQIASATGLPLEQVLALQKEVASNAAN